MASIHPSRMGLVPGASMAAIRPAQSSREQDLRRKLDERRQDHGERYKDEKERQYANARSSFNHQNSTIEEPLRHETTHVQRYDQEEYRSSTRRHSRSQSPREDRDRRHRSSSRDRVRRGSGGNHHDKQYNGEKSHSQDRSRRASPSYSTYQSMSSRNQSSLSYNGNDERMSRYGYGQGRGDIPAENGMLRPPPRWKNGGQGGWQGGPPRGGYSGVVDYEQLVHYFDVHFAAHNLSSTDDALSENK